MCNFYHLLGFIWMSWHLSKSNAARRNQNWAYLMLINQKRFHSITYFWTSIYRYYPTKKANFCVISIINDLIKQHLTSALAPLPPQKQSKFANHFASIELIRHKLADFLDHLCKEEFFWEAQFRSRFLWDRLNGIRYASIKWHFSLNLLKFHTSSS